MCLLSSPPFEGGLRGVGPLATWPLLLPPRGAAASHPYLKPGTKGSVTPPKRMNFRKSSKRPLTSPLLIFGKLCCRFFKKLYSLKNHICGIFLKSPGYESIKNNDPCCQIQSLNCTWSFLLKIGATNHPGKGWDPPPQAGNAQMNRDIFIVVLP